VDVLTFEFENIPVDPLAALSSDYRLCPRPIALATAQDRIAEKTFADRLGIPTAPWAAIRSFSDLRDAAGTIGTPSILKTARFGYDGKGQARIVDHSRLEEAWTLIGEQPAILEGWVTFDQEFSIVAVRDEQGDFQTWDASENVHRDGILDTSTAPPPHVAAQHILTAKQITRRIAEELGYVGVLAVEFFAGCDGPIFNEIAPRVHNSGHWTIEGAVTSQFENHIRAICRLPFGSTDLTGAQVVMRNLIGTEANEWLEILSDRSAHLHLYGKNEARAGRKMGHVTWVRSLFRETNH
jgi:5-(carboxyamino)imidazole ribonucleotide synthase